jgi:predicted SprT family Zn-dependent metalloprotease
MAKQNRPTEEAYTELQHAYDFYNKELFGGQLTSCLLTYQRSKRTFGYFSKDRFGHRDARKTHELALNPEYFAVVPLIEVLQTLVHEMTHLWQEHFGKPGRACYHNVQWANKMEEIGLMPSSTGLPGGKRIGQSLADYMIAGGQFEKVTKRLLSSGFAISWFDRFPALPPARFVNSQTTLASAQPDKDEIAGDAEFVAALTPPDTSQPGLIEQKTGNRSNRSKYTCEVCALNVWGKPGLRVVCATDKVQLREDAD